MPRKTKKKAAPKKATKKAAPKKAAPKKTKAAPKKKRAAALTEHGTHKLTRPQLQKWRMLDAEMRAAAAEAEKIEAQLVTHQKLLEEVILKYKEVAHANQRVVNALHAVAAARQEFKARRDAHYEYVQHLGGLLGVKMADCAIDPETGTVRVIPGDK